MYNVNMPMLLILLIRGSESITPSLKSILPVLSYMDFARKLPSLTELIGTSLIEYNPLYIDLITFLNK
jgi:hypothetical protein